MTVRGFVGFRGKETHECFEHYILDNNLTTHKPTFTRRQP